MTREPRPSVPINHSVVQRHVEEVALLYTRRAAIALSPSIRLRDLVAFDDRLLAHFDGVAVAGEEGWRLCEAALDDPSAGAVFTAAVRAVEEGRQSSLDQLFARSEISPRSRGGLIAAFGWLEPHRLRGTVASLLNSDDPSRRMVGIAACAIHGVDPGARLASWIQDRNSRARTVALRTAGELGRQDLVSMCAAAGADEDPECRAWGGWSAVMLGSRGRALEALAATVRDPAPHHLRAFWLALQAMGTSGAHALLQDLARDPQQARWLIQGSGIAGDPTYVPWLIKQMANDRTTRVAAEAFSFITGVDLSRQHLDRPQPENYDGGPNDDPADPNVDMDPDEGLPWPDVARIAEWWVANGSRFQAGTRYFMGAPVTRERCIAVLKDGSQRQRILAAHYLCLLDPGTPLFNTSAPAWRQQRLLAKMG